MVEEFPRFQLGFEFLNTEKSSSVKEFQNEATVPKKKRFAELTEPERNRLLVYGKLDKLGSKRFQRYEFT